MEIGHPLPALQLQNQENTLVSLADFNGKKLAIYFYPKDDTPGCTAQACSIRDGVEPLLEAGITVIGISADTVSSHLKFIQKHHLNFTLLSDPEKLAITQFGVWGPKKFMGKTYDGIHRKTFLFNEEGSLVHVIEKPNTKNHSEEIINFFNKAE
jgi:peroxiredoxin Q/BCP